MAKIAMRYTGNGFYVGVPTRDLSAEEVEYHGRDFLLALGLYEEVHPKPKRVTRKLEQETDDQNEED